MKSLHLAVLAFVGIAAALWWAVMPPRFAPPQGGPLAEQRRAQCPPGSRLQGKLCTCAQGSQWTGSACRVSWPPADGAQPAAATAPVAAGNGVLVYPVKAPATEQQGR